MIHERLHIETTVEATGSAGDVFVCHPFLAHSINPVGPARARHISNVAVHGFAPLDLDEDHGQLTPVERSIAQAIA